MSNSSMSNSSMINILLKEIKLSASCLSFIFIVFGLMFFLPGYPILCGAFFSSLGLFKSFENMRETNDILFSALLPIAKKDVVKGKFIFVILIEICSLLLMGFATIIRMTVLLDSSVYRENVMMNANLFALGMAMLIFGMFNLIFLGGFFKTGYKTGRPFIAYIIVCFALITAGEALHHFPGLGALNAFGSDYLFLQITLFLMGLASFVILTTVSYVNSCKHFELIDL